MTESTSYENINDLQTNLINTRRKYTKAFVKTDKQCNKMELKILERTKLITENTEKTRNFLIDEKLLKQFTNQDIENKLMLNELKFKLKKLDSNVDRISRVVNCDIYKEIYKK